MEILITNDDGIQAQGLRCLWQCLEPHAKVKIIAPASDQSGMGLGVTLRSPLQIESVTWDKGTPAWKINGTTTDCVKLGLSVVLDRPPDLIVSGINRGSNAGRNVLYSGTIGGVIEGVFQNIQGIAFSYATFSNPDYSVVEKYVYPIVKHVMENPLPAGTFLNVCIPEKARGVKFARQGRSYWGDNPDQRIHPEGIPYYWMGGKWAAHDEHEESDVSLLKQGYVTAAPIHVEELTDLDVFHSRRVAFESLF